MIRKNRLGTVPEDEVVVFLGKEDSCQKMREVKIEKPEGSSAKSSSGIKVA